MGINGLLKNVSPILIPVNEPKDDPNNVSRKSKSSSTKYNIRQLRVIELQNELSINYLALIQ